MVFSKGQSAIEQMITYGWAIMIVIIVIGVLAYFGVLNFSGAVPERCLFQTGFFCSSHRLFIGTDGNTTVRFELGNKFSRKITITGLLCSAEPPNPATGYPNDPRSLQHLSPGITILPEGILSGSRALLLTCYDRNGNYKGTVGESYEGIIYVEYVEEPTGFGGLTGAHIKVGNVGGRIN